MLWRLALSTALLLSPETGVETGGESAPVEPGAPLDGDANAEARALFIDGQAKYETHDYDGAIESFTAAYARAQDIEGSPRDEILARLSFNLARAHVSAYDIDHDAEHLTLARRLIADFRGHERARGRDPDADTDVRRLEQDLAKREQALESANSDDPVDDAPPDGRARGRRAAGITLLTLAAPFAGLAVGGAILGAGSRDDFETVTTGDERIAAQRRGRTGDILLGVGIGLAVVSATAGATLLGVSMKTKRARVQARLTGGGLVLEGAF